MRAESPGPFHKTEMGGAVMNFRTTVRRAFVATLPVMAGYMVLGIAFGILLREKGFGLPWAFAMSFFIFAGSLQFVAVNLLATGAALISTALMTLLVNARHLLYGISMLDRYRGIGKAKPYLIFALTDETYALVCNGAPEGTDEKAYYLLVTAMDHCWWVTGSVLGSLIGSVLTINTKGIDFAMTAFFVTIFTEQLITIPDRIPAAIGVGASVLCLVIFGPSGFLIPAMVLISALLFAYSLKAGKGDAANRADGTNEDGTGAAGKGGPA